MRDLVRDREICMISGDAKAGSQALGEFSKTWTSLYFIECFYFDFRALKKEEAAGLAALHL